MKVLFFLSTLIFSLLMLTSCNDIGEKPDDISTSDEKTKINTVISEMEGLFFQTGLVLDLNTIPVIVTNDVNSPNLGQCSINNFILLDKRLFDGLDEEDKESNDTISPLWASLAYQIGQCYFLRLPQNTINVINSPARYKFSIKQERSFSGFKKCRNIYFKDLPGSAMSDGNLISFLPKSLKPFYISELFKANQANNYKSLIRYKNISIVDENVFDNTTWQRCN